MVVVAAPTPVEMVVVVPAGAVPLDTLLVVAEDVPGAVALLLLDDELELE